MVKTIKTPTKKAKTVKKTTKTKVSKITRSPKKKPLHRKFAGLFKGRQQKGRVAVAGVAVMMFASVGAYLLFTSFAATPAIAPTGTYTDWNWPGQNYTSFDWQVTPGIDQTGPDAYFFSHQFGYVNGDGGYSGLQGDYNGKRAIFSLWQTLAAKGPEIAQPFGGEGTGYQTVINYTWVTGRTYQFHVQKEATEVDGVWWSSSVKDTVTGVVSPIGQIKVPLAWGALNNYSVVWTERYGGQMSTCNDIHHSKVTFTNFSANNGTIFPSGHFNHLGNPVNCPGSQFTDVRNGVVQEMGVGNDLPPTVPASTGTYLSDLSPTYLANGYGALQKDLSNGSHIITLNGQRYARGIGAHANADLRYNLGGQYVKFLANVGIDDEVNNGGSASFQVWADGTKLFDSGNMTGPTPTQAVALDVTGKQELKLIITDAGDGNGYDHADWADARLLVNQHPTASVTAATTATVNSPLSFNANAQDTEANLNTIEIYVSPHLTNSFTLVKNCTFAATGSANCTGSWTPSAKGSYDIVVNASDAAGAKCSGNPNVMYPYYEYTSCGSASLVNVNVTSSDTIAPTVRIASPTNGALVGNGAYISANASDNIGVTKLEIYVDGALKSSAAASSINYTWVSYTAVKGQHNITVKAYDSAGNIGQSTVLVTKY